MDMVKRFGRFACLLTAISGFLCYSGMVRAEIEVRKEGDLITAIVTNIQKLKFITPIPSDVYVSQEKLNLYANTVCAKGNEVLSALSCETLLSRIEMKQALKPGDLNITLQMRDQTYSLNAPLYTIREWFNLHKANEAPNLMVNANWYNIEWKKLEGRQALGPGYPYKMPVSTPMGYSVSGGRIVSKYDSQDATNGCLFDALIVSGMPGASDVSIVAHEFINKTPAESIMAAVAGFVIVNKKEEVKLVGKPALCNNVDKKMARTGIGLTADRQKLIVMVKQPGRDRSEQDGWTQKELAINMMKAGADYVINLDNSGSSQFLYTKDGHDFIESAKGDKLPVDIGNQKRDTEVYRTVPNFFGIIDNAK
jgi:hypothetical protein